MSERRWTRNDRLGPTHFRYINGRMERDYGEGCWMSTAYELSDMVDADIHRGEVVETFDHLPQPAMIDPQAELQALRQFRTAVIEGAQTTPNHKLPELIFKADDAVSKVVPRV